MQFYIIDSNPRENARRLPRYALKEVNIREGWQILSDIGHIHGVTWEGQNRLYSASHALTRQFCQSVDRFKEFVVYLDWCIDEYKFRYVNEKQRTCASIIAFGRWDFFTVTQFRQIREELPKDRYEQTRRYLLEYKRHKFTAAEI